MPRMAFTGNYFLVLLYQPSCKELHSWPVEIVRPFVCLACRRASPAGCVLVVSVWAEKVV